MPCHRASQHPSAKPSSHSKVAVSGIKRLVDASLPGEAELVAGLGAVIEAGAIGRVIASEHPGSTVGSTHTARSGVRAFPATLPKLFTGENIGMLVLAVP